MKECLLTVSLFLMGLFLLSASIVWAVTVGIVNRFGITQAYNYGRGLFMGNNNSEEILQTRSSVDRRLAVDRRSFLTHESIDHNPERRVNIFKRRMLGDRRGVFPEVISIY